MNPVKKAEVAQRDENEGDVGVRQEQNESLRQGHVQAAQLKALRVQRHVSGGRLRDQAVKLVQHVVQVIRGEVGDAQRDGLL